MKMRGKLLALSLMVACWTVTLTAAAQQKSQEAERLGRAIEYFSSGKYHEALLLFQKLDDEYDLNPRFKAYLGLCYYYEWNYEKATALLDSVISKLDVYAPHERSIYYFADAESHFNLGHYNRCIPLYEKHLQVCFDNEKGDAFYRIGFCYLLRNDYENAYDRFSSALAFYERYRNTPELKARITQLRKMLAGMKEKTAKQEPPR